MKDSASSQMIAARRIYEQGQAALEEVLRLDNVAG